MGHRALGLWARKKACLPPPRLLALVGLADQLGVHDQTGLAHQAGDLIGRHPVDIERHLVSVRAIQVPQPVPGLERQEHVSAGRQHPMALSEHGRQQLRRSVDGRVPGDDAAETVVRQVECGHRSLLEADARMRPAGDRDHLGGEVDAERVHPERLEKGRNAAWTAPGVGDRPSARLPHEFGERGEHGAVQRLGGQLVAEEPLVVGGDGVVRRPRGVQGGCFGHGPRP